MPFGQTGGTTITATMGMDTQQAQKALQGLPQHVQNALRQATTHTKQFQTGFSDLFKLEPTGERRGAHALARLSESLIQVGEDSNDAIRSVTAFGRAVSTGIVGGAIIGGVGILAEKFIEVNKAALETEEVIHRITAESAKTGTFTSLESLKTTFSESSKQAQKLYEEITRIKSVAGGGLGFLGVQLEATLRGFRDMPGHTPFEGFKGSAGEAYLNHLMEQRQELLSANVKLAETMAQKERESASIEETRFRTGERQADLMAEQIKHQEIAGALAKAATEAGVNRDPELAAEEERSQQAMRRIQDRHQLEQREFADRLRAVRVTQEEAAIQIRISETQVSGLTIQEKELAISRERVSLAEARLEGAEAEVQAAKEQLEIAKNLNEEAKRQAQLRLGNAQAAEMQARASVRQAAGGVAETRAAQLERAGREEEMTPEEKRRQLIERQKQFEGLRHAAARQGIRGELIEPPKEGEAEYDPLRRFKQAAAAEEELKARRGKQEQAAAEKDSPQVAVTKTISGDVKTIIMLMQRRQTPTPTVPEGRPPTGTTPSTPAPGAPTPEAPTTAPTPPPAAPTPPGAPTPAPSPTPAAPTAPLPGAPGGPQFPTVEAPAPPIQPAAMPPAPPIQPGVMPPPTPQLPPIEQWRQNQAAATKQFQLGQAGLSEEQANKIAQQQGINPNDPNLDWRQIANVSQNKQAFQDYWARPDVQSAMAEQQQHAEQPPPMHEELDWRALQIPRPSIQLPSDFSTVKNLPKPTYPFEMDMQPQPPQPEQPPQAKPSELPSPPTEGEDKSIISAIKQGIQEVMDKYWR